MQVPQKHFFEFVNKIRKSIGVGKMTFFVCQVHCIGFSVGMGAMRGSL